MADHTHLEEVPPVEAGEPTLQEMAEATDAAVFGMMTELRGSHPGLGGAIVAGTASGLARYQLQGMPEGSSGRQVLEVLAPIILSTASQIATGLRKAKGLPEPKVPVVAPLQTAFEKLTSALAAAPFPTFCIRQESHLLLVSAHVTPAGVLTHGSVANLLAATKSPGEVVMAHCTMAARSWTQEVPQGLLAKVRSRLAALPHEGPHDRENEGYALALRWVIEQFGLEDAPAPEGESHDGQA